VRLRERERRTTVREQKLGASQPSMRASRA
jgi:hypothetical protein